MNLDTFDLIRSLDRQKNMLKRKISDDEIYFVIDKLKCMFNKVQETQTITLQEVTDIYSIIFEINVDMVSNIFPFRTFFDIFEDAYPNDIEITYSLLLFIAYSSFGSYFDPKSIIKEADISILIDLPKSLQFKSCSLNLIASICHKDQNYVQIFCEKGLISALIDIEVDQIFSNFLTFLSENNLTEDQSIALSAFIHPLIVSEDTQVVVNGLCILNNLIKSPIKSLSSDLIDEYHIFLIIELKKFIYSNNEEIIQKILYIFHSIPNLSNEVIELLFYLINNNISESKDDYILICTQIFREQYNNWKSQIDVNLLFETLLPIVSNTSFQKEASIFLTLMRYGEYQNLSQPLMINLILRFISHSSFSKMCLKALNKLLSIFKSPELLFGDQLELFFNEISKLANSKDENIAIESSLLLERVFPR